MSIHPSIHYLYPLILGRITGGAGAYPSMHWARGRNTPWTGRQSTTGHTPFTHTLIT
uniref:Uncharacterized protein n=1 Tax=Anguilla anguilla TaxID=7936 RepID=A0A0E9VSE8_ANGAN